MTAESRRLELAAETNDLLRQVRDELKTMRTFFTSPAYVVLDRPEDKAALEELKKELCKPSRPGRIIPLKPDAFRLYQQMIPCPPRNP